jgi:hypothetical protein
MVLLATRNRLSLSSSCGRIGRAFAVQLGTLVRVNYDQIGVKGAYFGYFSYRNSPSIGT